MGQLVHYETFIYSRHQHTIQVTCSQAATVQKKQYLQINSPNLVIKDNSESIKITALCMILFLYPFLIILCIVVYIYIIFRQRIFMIQPNLRQLLSNDLNCITNFYDQMKKQNPTRRNKQTNVDSKFASMFTSQEQFDVQEQVIEVPTLSNKIKIKSMKTVLPIHDIKISKKKYNLRS